MITPARIRSNTPLGFGAFVLVFGINIWASRSSMEPRWATLVGLCSFSLVFLGTALAQLRSGYLWRNLFRGNRGLHRSESPVRFALSTAFHFFLAAAMIGFAMWNYAHDS
jgi:hypothetical protein